jgi:hypothetical protein
MWIISSLAMIINICYTSSTFIQEHSKRHFDYVPIVYREERWAQENRLYAEHPRYHIPSTQKPTNREKIEAYRNEKRIEHLNTYHEDEYETNHIDYSLNGKKLERERQYNSNKTKIIIHHSGSPTDYLKTQAQINKHIREIQELHSFHRERWDVGYHFIIDHNGKIYEWKSWWPDIVGAHGQFNNFDSIGISLLGNFNKTKIPDEQLKSLLLLTTTLTQYYDISLEDNVVYNKKTATEPYIAQSSGSAIGYHKMVGNTSCPGRYAIQALPQIREMVSFLDQNLPKDIPYQPYISKLVNSKNIPQNDDELIKFVGNSITKTTYDSCDSKRKWWVCKSLYLNGQELTLRFPYKQNPHPIFQNFLDVTSNTYRWNKLNDIIYYYNFLIYQYTSTGKFSLSNMQKLYLAL